MILVVNPGKDEFSLVLTRKLLIKLFSILSLVDDKDLDDSERRLLKVFSYEFQKAVVNKKHRAFNQQMADEIDIEKRILNGENVLLNDLEDDYD
jgi:hypothetical protein